MLKCTNPIRIICFVLIVSSKYDGKVIVINANGWYTRFIIAQKKKVS